MPETLEVNITDSGGDVKNNRTQAEKFIFWSLFGFVTHPILQLTDQIVQFALYPVELML